MAHLHVKAIEHVNVYEKKQYYIQFETLDGNQRYTINVGSGTFEKVKAMTENREPVIDEPKTQKGGKK